MPENKVLRASLVPQVLRVSEVPVALLVPRAPQALWVPKGSEVKWDFLVSKVTKDSRDHQDPKVTRVRKGPEASQGSLAFEGCPELWANPESKAQWAPLALTGSKVPEVSKA